ncbi:MULTISPECIES: TrmH family RNA methyltransferase [unclassified Nocardioides]|uniref:TrmH family RNA methyltransferase n=1 Tax=unclassified Nocardioides TaxID=2615069 RepID=UPI0006F4911D|nr:RNA methyltransferase [Nocardioides sp. Root614]KRA91152.1 RNA methyltransferase [Nocardioides sp. Root682]
MVPLTAGNTRVKDARKLHRRPERSGRRCFLADGPKAVEGALGVPDCVIEVFATPAAASEHAELLGAAPVTLVDDRAMGGLSDSVSPAGLVAVCRFLDVPLSAVVEVRGAQATSLETSALPLLAICADVRDPGNAGTVIRCADAAGAAGVVLAGDAVDLHNPKTIRASVGSAFHVPIALERDPAAAVAAARAAGYQVLAAVGGGELDLFDAEAVLAKPTAWLFGNEAWGLPDELAALADHRVSIPILGRAESLNLATAAAVCLYASTRAMMAG